MGNAQAKGQTKGGKTPRDSGIARSNTTSEVRKSPSQNLNEIPIVNFPFEDNGEDVKILTLGAGECGKSTLWRQLKITYCGGFTQKERIGFRSIIRQTIIEDIKTLIETMERNSQALSPHLAPLVESIKDLNPNDDELEAEVAKSIAEVWKDPMIKTIFKSANSIGLGENSYYFLDNVARIAAADFVPDDSDILKSRIRTVGISQLQFKIKEIKTLLVDVGGQKNERRNWQRCFQNVSYLLFVVSLSDFDQLMFEDGQTKRTDDSMTLFGQIANSNIFRTKPIFLVLNKLDIFDKKLKSSPEAFLQAYPGLSAGVTTTEAALEHVKKSFLNVLNADRDPSAWVEAIFTTAMDRTQVQGLAQGMASKIVQNYHP